MERFDFDELAKDLAQGVSRREALRRLSVGLLGTALGAVGMGKSAWAASKPIRPTCSSQKVYACMLEEYAEAALGIAKCTAQLLVPGKPGDWIGATYQCAQEGIATFRRDIEECHETPDVASCIRNEGFENLAALQLCIGASKLPPGLQWEVCVTQATNALANELRDCQTNRSGCPSGATCVNGVCCSSNEPCNACNGDLIPCTDTEGTVVCVDTTTDAENCGSCGHICTTTPICAPGPSGQGECCVGGRFDPVKWFCCPEGETGCNGTCCKAPKTCVGGQCQCPPNQTPCGDTCCVEGAISGQLTVRALSWSYISEGLTRCVKLVPDASFCEDSTGFFPNPQNFDIPGGPFVGGVISYEDGTSGSNFSQSTSVTGFVTTTTLLMTAIHRETFSADFSSSSDVYTYKVNATVKSATETGITMQGTFLGSYAHTSHSTSCDCLLSGNQVAGPVEVLISLSP